MYEKHFNCQMHGSPESNDDHCFWECPPIPLCKHDKIHVTSSHATNSLRNQKFLTFIKKYD